MDHEGKCTGVVWSPGDPLLASNLQLSTEGAYFPKSKEMKVSHELIVENAVFEKGSYLSLFNKITVRSQQILLV